MRAVAEPPLLWSRKLMGYNHGTWYGISLQLVMAVC